METAFFLCSGRIWVMRQASFCKAAPFFENALRRDRQREASGAPFVFPTRPKEGEYEKKAVW
jgi:hypothetical protein